MSIKVHLFALYTIVIMICVYVLVPSFSNKEQIVYINTSTVFKDFVLTKKLERQYSDAVNNRKHVLDSMMISLKQLNQQVKSAKKQNTEDESRLEYAKRLYLEQSELFEQNNAQMKTDFDKQIWNQLNQYIKDYGKQRRYSVILGADGSGSLMYASDGLDVTHEVLDYVNNRFSGEKK